MFALEPSLEPFCDKWKEYEKPALIKKYIEEICEEIFKKGEKSRFQDIYNHIYEMIEDNFEEYKEKI